MCPHCMIKLSSAGQGKAAGELRSGPGNGPDRNSGDTVRTSRVKNKGDAGIGGCSLQISPGSVLLLLGKDKFARIRSLPVLVRTLRDMGIAPGDIPAP